MKQLVGRAISSRLPLGSGGGAGPETAGPPGRRRWPGAGQSVVRDQSSFSLGEGKRAGPPQADCSLTALLNNPSRGSPKSSQ